MDGEARYDSALAAGYVILDMLQASPGATEEERLSVIVYAVLEAIYIAERLVGGFQAQPSAN
jgi:hypothetical protein